MKNRGLKIILSDKDNSSLEAFENVLKKFKKKVRISGVLKEVRDRMSFMKPSEKRRRKRLARNKRK